MQSVDIREFDAKGDGITDDSAAIQAAVNAMRGGGEIRLPDGRVLRTKESD